MKPWIVVVAAVLAGGCEQIKSLKNVHELEGKVEELTKQMAELQAKPGAGSGSGSGAAAKPEEKPETKDAKPEVAAKPEEKPEAKPEPKPDAKDAKPEATAEAKPEAEAKPDDKVADKPASVAAMGPADSSGKAATADAPPPPDAGIASDPAFEKLLSVVAENTARTRPNGSAAGPRWDYGGKSGSASWAALDPSWKACGDGKAQSPIDIEPRASEAKPVVFHYKPTATTVIDTGRTLQANVAPGNTIEIGGTVYQLTQLQFHAPSEHTIAGEHYPLEVQLVHKDATGKLAVISVMYDAGVESKPLAGLWSMWPHKPGLENKLARPFDPSALLPETRTVFRYTGSLTTPPCTEGVVWNVMRRTLSDSKAHLDAFAARYAHNSRELQALNERKIE